MRSDYAQLIRALASCTFDRTWELQLVGDLNAARYNEQAKPLNALQRIALLQIARKYRRYLPPDIAGMAAKLEEAK